MNKTLVPYCNRKFVNDAISNIDGILSKFTYINRHDITEKDCEDIAKYLTEYEEMLKDSVKHNLAEYIDCFETAGIKYFFVELDGEATICEDPFELDQFLTDKEDLEVYVERSDVDYAKNSVRLIMTSRPNHQMY